MLRVVNPGGLISAYAWTMAGGGFPFEPIRTEIRAFASNRRSRQADRSRAWRPCSTHGSVPACKRSKHARSRCSGRSHRLTNSGRRASAQAVACHGFHAPRRTCSSRSESACRPKLPADAQGRITCSARANAIKGRVPVEGSAQTCAGPSPCRRAFHAASPDPIRCVRRRRSRRHKHGSRRDTRHRVHHRVDDIGAKGDRAAGTEGLGAGGLDRAVRFIGQAAPEDVVLTARCIRR